jgi:polysaccharide export outer membrane protein
MGLRAHVSGARGAHRGLVVLAIALLASACTTPRPHPEPAADLGAYKVGAPDQLIVTILPDPIVTETVVVRPDGLITIQLIGEVRAADRTPDQIAAEIEERIGRYKRGARVTVAVARAESSAVTVLGEVRSPGRFALVKLTRVTEALGHVGGPTTFASIGSIRVIRTGGGGTEIHPVDFSAIRRGDLTTNIALEGGDIIWVPPTLLARFGYVVQQILFPFQPLIGVGQAAAGTVLAPN